MSKLKALIQYCQEYGRICPQPQRWQELYGLLPEIKRAGAVRQPALPLILAAWWDTPHLAKTVRLREHLEWADKNGALDEVDKYLRALPEDQWFHEDD
jgi:hypothetical protein